MDIKFRNSESLSEIISIIEKSKPGQSIVWQNSYNKRNVFSCNLIKLSDDNQSLRFHIKDYDDSLLQDRTLYVKLSYNHSLFKGIITKIEGSIFTVHIPTEVKTVDLREFPREVFLPHEEKQVVIELSSEIGATNAPRLHFTTLDISHGGLSIIVSHNNVRLMKSHAHQVLLKLGNYELSTPIMLDERYNQNLRYRLRGKVIQAHRFGFKFLAELPATAMERFIKS